MKSVAAPYFRPKRLPSRGPRVLSGSLRCAAALLIALTAASSAGAAGLDSEREKELLHLLRHDCGSCHGMTLKGGLGPALLPKSLEDKSEMMLRATILVGRAGTPMPPWRGILTEQEADWLARSLKEGVPDEH